MYFSPSAHILLYLHNRCYVLVDLNSTQAIERCRLDLLVIIRAMIHPHQLGRDIDTGELKEESEHLVVFKDGTRFTAYGAEEIKTFVKDILLLPETDTLFRNTNQAIKLAKRIKWIS